MKQILRTVGIFLFMLMLGACGSGKQSAVEGKLVDWDGKPVAGVKITAVQVQPLKGYEQFEAETDGDGMFRLEGLFPSSAYVLKPWSDKWSCEIEVAMLESAPQGETAVLSGPIHGGCKQSAVEGKLMDWYFGKPVAGVKIIATQLQPLKGYEQFETESDGDGAFRVEGLYPSSRYVLKPWSDIWDSTTVVQVESAQQGGTEVLSEPMRVTAYSKNNGSLVLDLVTGKTRFSVTADGVINDSVSGLEWIAGPDQGTEYNKATQWVVANQVAGGGWRMPTREDLKTLYQPGVGERNIDPVFKTSGWGVWAEPYRTTVAWNFSFKHGVARELRHTYEPLYLPALTNDLRVFGVRLKIPAG